MEANVIAFRENLFIVFPKGTSKRMKYKESYVDFTIHCILKIFEYEHAIQVYELKLNLQFKPIHNFFKRFFFKQEIILKICYSLSTRRLVSTYRFVITH